ncbi:OFA family MFS transporter [Raoultibacter massiliensis]|uniref:OFA family MFS transporter n=1 Tax=Raoultibacter massiliensis TaxID=1852371 RepID=A0ABV1J8N0_9ACTN|nr:OFA family MFS transporter [Raoultibacter massiliensis]
MTESEKQIKYGNRWGYLVKGFIMTMFLGILYAWSIFIAPLEEAFGWVRTETTITYSIMMVTFALGQLTAGFWSRMLKSQSRALTLFSFLLALGFFLTSFTESLPWLYFWYGGFCGYTLGVANNCIISAAPKWFPDKAGLAMGIIVLGFGLASLVLGQLATFLIGSYGYVIAMRVLAVVCFVMVTCVSLLFKVPPLGYTPPGYVASKNESDDIATGYSPRQVLRTRQFWMIYLWDFCNHFAGFMIISLIVPHGVQMGMPVAMAALVMGIFGVCNAFGRPLFGAFGDRVGRKTAFIVVNALMVVGLLAIAFLPSMMEPLTGLVVGAVIMGLSFGGSISLKCSSMRTYFGNKYVTANIGLIASDDAPTGILGPMVAAAIFVATGAYFYAFLVAAVVSAIGILFPFFVGKPVSVAERFPNEVDGKPVPKPERLAGEA